MFSNFVGQYIASSRNLLNAVYSVLPLPHCQIIISTQSVHVSSHLFLLCLFPYAWRCFPLRHSSASFDTVPCLQSDFSSVLLLCPGFPTLRSLGFPSGPAYPVPPPLAPASASAPGFQQPTWASPGLHSIFPCVSINTLVSASQSPRPSMLLGSPVSALCDRHLLHCCQSLPWFIWKGHPIIRFLKVAWVTALMTQMASSTGNVCYVKSCLQNTLFDKLEG